MCYHAEQYEVSHVLWGQPANKIIGSDVNGGLLLLLGGLFLLAGQRLGATAQGDKGGETVVILFIHSGWRRLRTVNNTHTADKMLLVIIYQLELSNNTHKHSILICTL